MIPHDAGAPEPLPTPARSRNGGNPILGRIEPTELPSEWTAGQPPALTAAPDVGSLVRALRQRWMAALAIGLPLAALAAAAAWFLLSPKYTAFAQFRVLSVSPVVLNSKEGTARYDFPTYIRTLAWQLRSRPVIMQALKSDEVKRLNLDAQRTDPVLYLDEELKTEFNDQTEFLTLLMSSSDPVEAVAVVKGVGNAFMDQIVYAETRSRSQRLTDLEKVYGETNDGLKKKKADLKKMADQLGTTDKEVLTQQQQQMLEALRDAKNARNQIASDLFRAQASLDAHKTRLATLQRAPVAEPDLEIAVDADPEMKQLAERIKRMDALAADYGPESREPTAKAARAKVLELKKKQEDRRAELAAKLKRAVEKRDLSGEELVRVQFENHVKTLTDELERRDKDVKDLAGKVALIGASTNELEGLRADVRREEQLVNDLGSQVDRLRVEVRSNPPRVMPFQEADLQKKDMKKQILATVAAPVAVFFAVCMSLAWSQYQQRRVRSASELSEGLGLRVVGAVPLSRHPERHLVGPHGEADLAAYPVLESFDAIRTLLLHDAHGQPARVVQVTSAVGGEGKTTLACHLATSLARAGRKTLLLDGDLRRPAVHQLFELPLQAGFSEVLLGEVEVAEAVQQTTLTGLSIMAAGQWDREVLQALSRFGLEGVFEKLQQEFDFIVVDSHPVLSAADALLLARQVDAVILSVLREVSQTPRVYAASQRLEAVGARVLGAVVHAADPEEAFANPTLAQPARR